MSKRELKKVVLRALADELENGSINWTDLESQSDEDRLDAVLSELADEFSRRASA